MKRDSKPTVPRKKEGQETILSCLTRSYTTTLTLKHLNCSSSAEGQDQDSYHLDLFNKPGEPVEEGTALHSELLSTGTVYHLQ